MENKTEMGLLLLVIGMILSIIASLASLATGSLGGSSLSPGVIIPAILGFIAFICLIGGFILMITSRKDWGEEHSQFAIYGLVMIIIAVVLVFVGAMLTVISGLPSELGTSGEELELDYVSMARGMRNVMYITQIGSILFTLGWILLVFHLENDMGKKVLYITLIAAIAAAIVAMTVLPAAYDDLADRMENMPQEDREDEFTEGVSESTWVNGLAIISSVLLLIGYIIPYQRIKNGELKPIPPPAPPFGAQPYPYQYPMYQQPYPPYPPGQPPMGPPPGQVGLKPQEGPAQPQAGVPPAGAQPVAVTTKKCVHCGTQIPEGAPVCPVCQKQV